ncbi:MAG: hypothetical protein Ct9H90mP16_21690 [Candidatus Poseidoniales archaeon]|nr:MAG: hypothetical protein Ct9H90mP16_21690 [Candidatus Poseidoniales archaeon]
MGGLLRGSRWHPCSNGSVALIAALHALDVGHGDEVIVPSHTYIARRPASIWWGNPQICRSGKKSTTLLTPRP